ncbi:hypothetical protein [Kribbella sp. NPDC004536]|uniref:hypothetical protein n=1 Tax=Kribbella sp. NPDC004536 TaxID=3364106 RepID=UPI0036B1FF72
MTEVDLDAVYRAAEKLLQLGSSSGATLAHALNGISHEAVASACGGDETGVEIFQGFSARAAALIDAGTSLQESLMNISDGVSASANLVAQVDGHNADALRAADLGLLPNGKPLPTDAQPPAPTPGR